MNRHTRHLIELVLVVALAVFFGACSNKKNTAGSRFWQSLNTRYNVYYHGRTNYDEQLKEMLDNYQDDYSQRLFVHPAEARSNPKAPQPAGSFDRTIEKMQKAIALHSIKKKPNKKSGKGNDPKYKAWMAREEYNPFMHNCWYTLALAQYMKGDFLNASATFRYISRHFSWKPDLVEEAKVWEALSYCAMGWTSEADNVLSHVHLDKINNKRVRSLANLAFADYYIKEKHSALAVPYLAEAVKGAKGSQKVRQNFLLGQLYEELDQKDLAYEAFKRAGSSNNASYRTKFNARIKQSAVYQGYDIAGEVRALKHMTRYDRNKEYLDQIYYAIGNLYLSRDDTTHAVENYILAAEKSTRNGIDKAISQLKLGGIYFAQHKYDLAQPCYAEAVPQLSEDYPNYKAIKQRSDVLDELAVYAGNVTLQDSLLKLSKMSDTEVKAVIKKIIDELKKKEKEERENADRENYLANQASKGNLQQNNNAPQQFSMNNDKSWYFYNTQTKNAGKTQFQQRWGNRKLEDNWRRRNKQVFSLDGGSTLSDSTLQAMIDSLGNDSIPIDTAALRRAEDPHYEEYYLKQIPKTEEQIQAAHEIIQEGLYNMGVILKDKLEDYEAASVQFIRLLTDYPDNTYRLDTYYNMYLMYMREGSVNRAAVYRNMILSDFADSKEGKALLDPNYIENLKRMNIEQERMYAEAYANYLNDNNEAVHEAYAEMMRKYPLSKIMPKFMFIDALSYVTQRNYDKFKETIKDMLQRYPETDITPTASGIVKQLNAGRKLEGGGSNARGMLWSTRLSNDTTPQALEGKFTPFQEDNDKPQVFILLYPTDTVSSRLLLYEVARHNFNSFVVKDYDLEQMNFGRLGLLVVKGFENFNEVSHYRKVFDADTSMAIPPQVHQVLISESNFQLLLNEGRTFEDYFNYLQEQEEAKAEKIKKGDQKTSSDDEEDEPDGKKRSVKDKKGKTEKPDSQTMTNDSTQVKSPQLTDSLQTATSLPDSLQTAMSQSTDSLQTNLTQATDTVSLLTEAEKQLQAQLQEAEKERLAQIEREKKEKEEQAEQERLEQMRRQRQEELERAAKLDQELLEKKEQERLEQEKRDREERERREAEEREKRMKQSEQSEKPDMSEKPAVPDMSEKPAEPDMPDMKPAEPDMPEMKPAEPDMPEMKPTEPDMPEMKPTEPENTGYSEKAETEKPSTRSVRDKKDKKEDTAQQATSPKQDKKAQEKAEKERLKALDKAEKERAKQLEKEEKEREKARKKEQKEQEKAEKRAERLRQDSLLRAEENREKMYKSAREAKEDSIEALQKAKADEIKNKQKEREQAKKDAEKARKERLKAKEKERKLKEKERKERMKEREAKRKEQQKLRKEQQKEREKANKERQKQREEERKQQAAERKAAKDGKSKGGSNATTGRSSRNNTKDGKASGKSTTGKSSVDNSGNAPTTGSNDQPDNSGTKPDGSDDPDGSDKP